jgi:hypothetical protein
VNLAPLIALAAIGGIVVLVVLGLRLLLRTARTLGESTRAKALADPAARLGLISVADNQLTDLPPFEVLNTGTDRHASNVLRGSVSGTSVVVFDYSFFDATKTAQRFRSLHHSTGPHSSQDLAGATVCCVKGSWLSLPEFAMEPLLKPILKQAEALVDEKLGSGKMASVAHALMQAAEGMIQEAPGFEFTDRPDVPYRIRGKDEPAIRALFTSRVLDYFRDHPGWIVEGQGDWLLLTMAVNMKGPVVTIQTGANARQDGQLPADQLDALVKAATETLELFRGAVSR